MFLRDVSIKHSTKVVTISQQTLTFLKENIYVHARIVCWIVNKLMSIVPDALCNVIDDLQDIYFSTLKLCLEHIPVRKNWHSRDEVLESCSLEAEPTNQDDHLQIVLCLLLQIDINADTEMEFLKTFYPILSKIHNVKDVELSLYSRKSKKLFSEWLLFWDKTHACSESITTLDMAYKIGGNIFKLTENSKILLCKQELLKRTNTKKLHWMNDILVSIIFYRSAYITLLIITK